MPTMPYTKPCAVTNMKERYEENHGTGTTDNNETDVKRCPASADGDAEEKDPKSSPNYSKETYFENRKGKRCPYCGKMMKRLSYAVS
jgi:hypothetical protein